jgi:hypothetical protein
MAKNYVKIGDILAMPLSNGRFAFGQYLYYDNKYGPLTSILDLISETTDVIDLLKDAKPLFPPIITGINAAVRTKMWKVIGNIEIKKFIYPGFISANYNEKTGVVGSWFLWNGERSIYLGSILPDKYKRLEYLVVWSQYDVIDRIEFGKYPQFLSKLINENIFIASHHDVD